MKNIFSTAGELGIILFIVLLIVVPLRTFVFQPFLVRGNSMEPNYHNGDYLVVDELSYRFREPGRGEVIVFKAPKNLDKRYIKRIVGLPGETVEITSGKVIIYANEANGQGRVVLEESTYIPEDIHTSSIPKITLGNGEYFVLGDNREHSEDSRSWGVLPEDYIIGKVFVRIFPLSALAHMEAPTYPN
ncbi:MAG: signal peptidase I [Candidatus Wildermuthbacteria bacterium]|nr:signal peptidase I [Candidatus Wildermuthbacteria bacterium]